MPEIRSHGARPRLVLDGSELRSDLAALVATVVVDTNLHQPDMVQVSLRDPGHDVFEQLHVRVGSTLTISATALGDGRQSELVQAEITSLERDLGADGSIAVLRGYDRSHRLSRGRRTATYNDVTDSDVVRQVADRAGVELGRVDATLDHAPARLAGERHGLGLPDRAGPGDRSRPAGGRRPARLAAAHRRQRGARRRRGRWSSRRLRCSSWSAPT